MRSYLLLAALFVIQSSFYFKTTARCSEFVNAPKRMLDFNVQRLSGDRVFLSWHTDDLKHTVYEVLRKHKILSQFVSLGIVQPKPEDGSGSSYAFVDSNNHSDSSYYCLKQTTKDSVIFFSLTKGVEGIGRNR